MIDGVIILAQEPIYETVYSWGWSWGGFALGIIAILILAIIIYCLYHGVPEFTIFLVFVMILLACSINAFRRVNKTEVYLYEQYKVVIDDSVSLNEFNKKYDIIDQEGKIYTVILKDNGTKGG